MHIPAKTTTVCDTNPPIEITQKQSLAMSNFWFSGRPVTRLTCRSLETGDWLFHAVTRYSSDLKSQSQYRPFRVVILLTGSRSPHDPNRSITFIFWLASWCLIADCHQDKMKSVYHPIREDIRLAIWEKFADFIAWNVANKDDIQKLFNHLL